MKLPIFVASKRSQSSIRQLIKAERCMNLGAAKTKSRWDSGMLEGLTDMHACHDCEMHCV